MYGIDLNNPILFRHASLKYFEKGEHHVNRVLPYDVLLLVFDGVLRFSEDGVEHEVSPERYYIQKAFSKQCGDIVSESPQYLYVHFNAEWSDCPYSLSTVGTFSYDLLKDSMRKLDKLSHSECSYIEKTHIFYEILSVLNEKNQKQPSISDDICQYINDNYINEITLTDICAIFNYSKNHIINIFKAEYNMTPIEYLNDLRLKKAMHLLEGTSKPAEDISTICGFNCYSHFYKQFAKKTGISPTEWRKKISRKPSLLYNVYSNTPNE